MSLSDVVNSINEWGFVSGEAVDKGFKPEEVLQLKKMYDNALSDYISKNPYSVYRENSAFDKKYFFDQRSYAASVARQHIASVIDAWQKSQAEGDNK